MSEWHYLAGYCFRAMKALPLILLFTCPLGRRGHGRLVVWGIERLVPLCLCLCCSVLFLLLEGGRMLALPALHAHARSPFERSEPGSRRPLVRRLGRTGAAYRLSENLGRHTGKALFAASGRTAPQPCLERSSAMACPAAVHRRHEFAGPLPLDRAALSAAMGATPLAGAPARCCA